MSKPSFENIDRWIFEYVEGNLSADQMAELEHFILLHPELELDLDTWKDAKIQAVDTPVFHSNHLQKTFPWTAVLMGSGFSLVALLTIVLWFQNHSIEAKYFAEKLQDNTLIEIENTDENQMGQSHDANKQTVLPLNQNSNLKEKQYIASVKGVRDNATNYSFASNKDDKLKDDKLIADDSYKFDEFISPSERNLNQDQLTSEEQSVGNRLQRAKELNEVIESINGSSASSILVYSNEIASAEESTANKSAKSSSSKSIKSRLNSAFRKIKRMMDQPIALQNSKDPYVNVPGMTGFQSNFGMVGTLLRDRFQLTSRNQWVGKENQQLTNTISWDGYVFPLRGGLGIDVTYSDYADGSIRDMHTGFTYSPKLSVSKNVSIEPAFRYKMGVTSLDINSNIIGGVAERHRNSVQPIFEEGEAPIGSRLYYRDLGAGVMMNTKWFYAGVNIDNLRRHYNNYYSADVSAKHQADIHFSTLIGTEYSPLGRNVRFGSYVFYQKFGELNEIWGGISAQWDWLEIGASVNSNLDGSASIGLRLNQLSVYYNADYLTSRMFDEKYVSHQITMRYLLKPSRYAAKYLMK
jgi:hypothetical protein